MTKLPHAAELDSNTEPTFTPEEVEMIAAPWSYLQSQQETAKTDPRDLIQRLVNALDDRLDFEERMYPGEGYMPLIAEARNYLATPELAAGPTDERLLELDELRDAWNAQADAANSWDELGMDEIVWFAQQQALARWGHQAYLLQPNGVVDG